MRLARILLGLAIIVLLVCGGFLVFAWHPEIERVARPDPSRFAQPLIQRGAQLAALGNCIACHTVPDGRSFAGGLALPTPFGTLYSTNITPDEETGIGAWSEEAFIRAMRRGLDRAGNHLYPAFPYDHFTKVSDEDDRALYAYLMTRQPVRYTPPANDLRFPFNIRLAIAGWKLLYFHEGPFQPDAGRNEAWNRGAYLAEGLGHCGSCHTPRNVLQAEDAARHFGGGEAEGWNAYAIDPSSPAPIPWDVEDLAFYLRHGWHPLHGVSRGPMAEVTGNLGALPDEDVAAIAHYVTDVMGEPTPERRARADELRAAFARTDDAAATAPASPQSPGTETRDRGATIYAAACSSCHDSGRPQPFGGLSFFLSTAVNAPNPQNIVNVTLFGLPPADGEASAVMPAFGSVLSDEEMVALLQYLREHFTTAPAWNGLSELVRDTRSGKHYVRVLPADGIERSPANVGAKD
jgi:mono/diheme cytochrome c family protein